ncbi:reverse transcriptase family protein [Blastomonas sp.]|uniref:reverse transcriptase family protein n=1 Tax=Blastomonas sp. TaxID=1909299 RepID=UPI00391CE717
MNKKTKNGNVFIPLEKSHLFGVQSIHLLAKKLGFDVPALERLANKSSYRVFNLKETGRLVEEPPPVLQTLHRKIHKYISRIQAPDYLHSAIKGRSYISNATAHIGSGSMIKIDVKKFFPSVPQHMVMHFFRDTMMCAGDVAGLLANLLCRNGRLPTGGAASPIISYYAFKSMFDEIEQVCLSNSLIMTCYVDDLTISGYGANRCILHQIRLVIAKFGLQSHKAKFFDSARPKLVTGAMVKGNRLDLPYSRWKAIRASERELDGAKCDQERLKLYPALISRLHEAAQIEPGFRSIALRHNEVWRNLRNLVAT